VDACYRHGESTIEPAPCDRVRRLYLGRSSAWTALALCFALFFFGAPVGLRRSSPKEYSGANPEPNSLIGLVVSAAHVAGKALNWFVNSAEWAIVALTVFSMLLLAVAIMLFAVGRGSMRIRPGPESSA